MGDTAFAVPEGKGERYARALPNDPLSGKPQSVLHAAGKPLKFECGGGCAVSTASDYLRFCQMLLNRGALDGAHILGRKTVEYMTADHLGPEIRNTLAASRGRDTVLGSASPFGGSRAGPECRERPAITTGLAPTAPTSGWIPGRAGRGLHVAGAGGHPAVLSTAHHAAGAGGDRRLIAGAVALTARPRCPTGPCRRSAWRSPSGWPCR
jgi:CubicO group peptidase (beta-lactamase class C family)